MPGITSIAAVATTSTITGITTTACRTAPATVAAASAVATRPAVTATSAVTAIGAEHIDIAGLRSARYLGGITTSLSVATVLPICAILAICPVFSWLPVRIVHTVTIVSICSCPAIIACSPWPAGRSRSSRPTTSVINNLLFPSNAVLPRLRLLGKPVLVPTSAGVKHDAPDGCLCKANRGCIEKEERVVHPNDECFSFHNNRPRDDDGLFVNFPPLWRHHGISDIHPSNPITQPHRCPKVGRSHQFLVQSRIPEILLKRQKRLRCHPLSLKASRDSLKVDDLMGFDRLMTHSPAGFPELRNFSWRWW
ncbi:hypothetical protein [Chloracidobacterium thermophilum]|uniref:hypothetical protein n=1 Tax=Chloracidobacterium thermophilum TaxID=458033 RepID=UPI0012FE8C8E|nr:hypothetical protein [Chloracidobacterium thermophilum]